MISKKNVSRKSFGVNKGKLFLIINLLLILFVAGSCIEANDINISVDKVLTGSSTSLLYPASYLIDDNLETKWAFKQGAYQAWAELRLSSESLIYGLKLDGYLATGNELKIEYYQEGDWLPFLAPTVSSLASDTVIDLSYDQIVTDRIRLFVSGSDLTGSYLVELKVLGIPAQEYYHQIKIKEITATENTDPVYQADFLNDGNTYTSWKTAKESKDWQDRKFDEVLEELTGIATSQSNNDSEKGKGGKKGNNNGQQTAEIEFNLGTEYTLDNIKLFLTNHSKGKIELQVFQNGNWQHLDSTEGNQPGWFRFDLKDSNLSTNKVKLIVTGYGGELGGISEVEFWGTGNYKGETPKIIGIQHPRTLDKAVNSQFELTTRDIKEYILELTVKENSTKALTIEINGKEITLKPAFNLRGYTVYKKKIEKENLWTGKNYLKVQSADNLTLVNSRLSSKVRTNPDPQLGDGLLFGPANNSSEIAVNLDNQGLLLPPFPAFAEPPYIPGSGSRKIENWSGPTVIDHDVSYDTLTINTELQIDTRYGDVSLVVMNLYMGSNGSISITGTGKVYLYLENDLNISNGSRINGTGQDNSLEIYHTGNRINIQGGIGGQDQYKFTGNIYTTADNIFIQNGANYKGKLYALNGDITIRGGITASSLIYAKTVNISITGGANVSGKIISGGNRVEIYGGSSFDGSNVNGGFLAPSADIYLDGGATIKGDILANPEKVHIGNINHQQSSYRIPETRNLEKKYIEEITIYSSKDNPYFYLYAWVDNNWLEVYQTAEGLKSVTFKDYIKTDKLLVKNSGGLAVTEVIVKYSTVANREPEVEILKPEDNQHLTHQELSRENIIGYVDNPDTEITINGQQAYHRGHYFWLEANRIGAHNNKANIITAVAKDNTGRVNYDSKTIYVGQSLLNVDLAAETIFTKEDTLTVSGSIRHPLNQLTINGEDVNIVRARFSKEIELSSGLNLIKIEGSKVNWQGKKEFTRTIYRKVVKLTPINLTINSPLDGYYTNEDSIIVSGMVDGLGELTVKVNDQETILDGAVYTSYSVALEEGSNIIKIEASSDSDSVEKKITVIRDSTAPVLSAIIPEDDYISNNANVSITGEVTDDSPVQVYVNGWIANLADISFDKQLTFIDGQHQITIKAVDMAGNEAYYNFNIIVDTTAPEAFEVIADPADWTSNTRPVITFQTSDVTSGINHYELKIDDGQYVEVVSPYQLPAQADGEHTITVKAVDNAGWETLSTTKVYIDTTPPEIPDNFRAISGPDKAHLKWERTDEEDVVSYRVYRQPVWSEGEYITLGIEDPLLGLEEEHHYIDTEVNITEEYDYWIESVDWANNISDSSNVSTVEIGIKKQPVIPENEEKIEIEYEEVKIEVPEKAIPEEGIIEITTVKDEDIKESEKTIVSKTFNFNFLDSNGAIKEDIEFNKDLTITINYDEELIPEGYSPLDLYIYYYSEVEERWIRLERARVDLETQQVSALTDHFSMYNVQVKDNYSPSADQYEDLGISPYQTYFKNNQEIISPASGSLTINGLDYNIPGRNSFDLNIARIHNINTVTMEKLKKAFKSDQVVKGYQTFGEAWNINLPWIETNDQGTFIHFEDGSASKIQWKFEDYSLPFKSRKLISYNHDGRHFYAEKNTDKTYKVITKDGKKYSFNSSGMVTEIVDRTGNNKITLSYSGRKINWIEDTIGRRMIFTYSGDYISSITIGDRVFRYNYDGSLLTEVIDPEGRKTEFNYTTIKVTSGSSKNKKEPEIPVIEKIVYPTGGISIYQYSCHGIRWYGSETHTHSKYVRDEKGKYVDKDGNHYRKEKKTRHYPWSVYDKTTIVIDKHYQTLSVNDAQEIATKVYSYRYNHEYPDEQEHLNSTSELDDKGSFRIIKTTITDAKQKKVMSINKDNLITSKIIYDLNNNELEKIEYQYNDNKDITWEEVYKAGSEHLAYKKMYDYDNWGNVIYTEDTGTGLITSNFYHNAESFREEFRTPPFNQGSIYGHIHNLPGGKRVYNSNNRDKITAIQESAYQYDSNGNLLTKAVYHQEPETGNSIWLETKYSYDQYGNITEIVDPLGNKTEMIYSYEYKQAYPTLIRKTGQNNSVKDADGNITDDSIQKYGYNFNTGLKAWEIDPLGNLTEYRYDILKRLVKITYPDEDDLTKEELKNIGIANLTPSYYSSRRNNNPVKIQHYDDDKRITTVVNDREDISIDHYRVNGNTIEEPIINKSKYYYDTLNRWIKLEQYLKDEELLSEQESPFVTQFFYDERSNRYKTIDAEGKETTKEYDPLNRVEKITYHDGSSTGIEYNDRENSRIITDPEGNKTKEVKDWAGNVITVYKYDGNEEYSSYANYDDVGNKIYEIDGNNRRTDFYYDDLNKLVKKELPADEYVMPGNTYPTSDYRPTVVYKYNDNGNKIAEITANGNTGTTNPADYTIRYQYDELNRQIKIIDPAGNETKAYYNPAGQKLKIIDPLGNESKVAYDSRGREITAIDGEGNISYLEYDIIGKKTAEYGPRGVIPADDNPEGITGESVTILDKEYILADTYKTSYQYDSLGRQTKITDPLGNTTIVEYDQVGNMKQVINGEQSITYEYNDLYFLEKEIINKGTENERITSYTYDKVGNRLTVTDSRGKVTTNEYDDLYRLIKVTRADGSSKEFEYDKVGNKVKEIEMPEPGQRNTTRYFYNSFDQIKEVIEPGLTTSTKYYYDLESNLIRKEMANGLETLYEYNNFGQLIREIKPGNEITTFSYDAAGNVLTSINPLGVKTVYLYNSNNQVSTIEYYQPDKSGNYASTPAETISYTYDRAGNRKITEKRKGETLESRIGFTYDALSRIIAETRHIESKSYTTSYRYDRYGNLTGIKYPASSEYLEYNYDNLNQLRSITDIAGDIANPAFDYYSNGSLKETSYDNGITTTYAIDDNGRVDTIDVTRTEIETNTEENILSLDYDYDGVGNITRRNNNSYEYDALNRLKKAHIEGTIYTEKGNDIGYAMKDYAGDKGIDITIAEYETITLDYVSGSIGVDLGLTVEGISKIELKTIGQIDHRLTEETIDILVSDDNQNYSLVGRDNWSFEKDYKGDITLIINNSVTARYIKVHCKYDDWDVELDDKNSIISINSGEFNNLLKDIIKVYKKSTEAEIIYSYDDVGNRTKKIVNGEITDYSYYFGTNRLMSDENYGYVYDEAGNLIKKGNRYSVGNNMVTFTETVGEGVEYYEYEYNLQNRLSRVTKNGEVAAEFLYDADGMRIKAVEKLEEKQTNRTTYYVYGYSGKVLIEESSDTSSRDISYSSYIYAFGKTFAKVDGIVGVSTEISYFHYDNVGSTRLMTDSIGKIIMDQDYLPFGRDLPRVGQVEVYNEIGMEYKFTGQNEVVSIGLYYYGARYYDPAIGRFITEDSYPGEMGNPQSQNLYVYVVNNPLRYVDPTGNVHAEFADSTISYPDDETESNDNLIDPSKSSGSGNKPNINLDIDLNLDFDVNPYKNSNHNNYTDIITDTDINIAYGQIVTNTHIEISTNDTVREVSDLFIAITTAGTGALKSGALKSITSLGSSAYAMADKGFEKAYYWTSDKLGAIGNAVGKVGGKIARLFGRGKGKNVFWSGSDPAKKAAEKWALNNNDKTLEMTANGIRLEEQTKNMLWEEAKPLWEQASKKFAESASGEVHVFHNIQGIRIESVWATIEYNELLNNPNVTDIIYHLVEP